MGDDTTKLESGGGEIGADDSLGVLVRSVVVALLRRRLVMCSVTFGIP